MSDEQKELTEEERIALISEGVKSLLLGLGLDLNDPHLQDTPLRVAKTWRYELCRGLITAPKITMFPAEGQSQMVILHDIPVRSVCAHHLLPFIGTAVVGYIPGGDKIFGLSKLSRIVDSFARRPQVQERLTNEIADYVFEKIRGHDAMIDADHPESGGVGVFLRCNHMCMELRGVEHPGNMTTSAIRGVFNDPEVREEFMRLALARS